MTECRNDSAGNGHRRVLIPGRDAHDPAGLRATAHLPSDVRPATVDGAGRYDRPAVTAWLRSMSAGPVCLVPGRDRQIRVAGEGGQPR